MSGDEMATFVLAPSGALVEPRATHSFAELYQAWFGQVHRWIRALGGPCIDAEDLTQEVFIVVQRKLDRFDGANLAGWLFRIAQLTVRDARRRAWFRNILSWSHGTVLDDIVSPDLSPDEQLTRKQRELRLYRLVHELHPRWRDSFLLFEVAGLSGEEISRLQGIPAATVRTHVSRARKELRDLVANLQAKGER